MARQPDEIDEAIETFVRAFSFGKSKTHPYAAERIGALWVMRDAPRKNPRYYRKEEWIAYRIKPQDVDAAARGGTRGRFFIGAVCGIGDDAAALRTQYKALGYRLLTAEPLFVHGLARIPQAKCPALIRRVHTPSLAEQFARAAKSRPIAAERLADARFRQYVAIDGANGGEIVGWVHSLRVGQSSWCGDMFVRPSHRRRGIGRTLLVKMLRDDRTRGTRQSVLLSSKTGALVYPTIGYEQIGTMLIWALKINKKRLAALSSGQALAKTSSYAATVRQGRRPIGARAGDGG